MDRKVAIMVALGGAIGAVTRWTLIEAVESGGSWPTEIFLVNVLGCAFLGYLVTRFRPVLHTSVLVGAITGFCGTLTTFSTFALELALFLDEGRLGLALSYLLASLVLGIAAFRAGMYTASVSTPVVQP